MRKCPISGDALQQEDIHGITVDVSPYGMWLDKGEFLSITEVSRHKNSSFMLQDLWRRSVSPPVDAERVLRCPICDEPMKLEKHRDIHLDWCRDHGVWLDKGEMEAMLNNLRLDTEYLGKIATRLWEGKY
jgi:Zn-finger nucleic acid-binding protein